LERATSCLGVTLLLTLFIFIIRVVFLVELPPLVVESLYYLVKFLIIALERS
jgi:hypothetical protein